MLPLFYCRSTEITSFECLPRKSARFLQQKISLISFYIHCIQYFQFPCSQSHGIHSSFSCFFYFFHINYKANTAGRMATVSCVFLFNVMTFLRNLYGSHGTHNNLQTNKARDERNSQRKTSHKYPAWKNTKKILLTYGRLLGNLIYLNIFFFSFDRRLHTLTAMEMNWKNYFIYGQQQ